MRIKTKRHDQILTVFSLARAHLRHEWILSLCLIAALSAVIAPLLILMGLKVGVITTLRDGLVEDPAFREIRPAITREYDQQWLEKYRHDARIDYIVPGILPASSIVYVSSQTEDKADIKRQILDLNPTLAGDTLLIENQVPVPSEGECVLTHSAAAKLDVAVNDIVTAQVTRSVKGQSQKAEEHLKVIGILPVRASSISAVYTTLAFVEDVEAYKEGRNVAKRDWEGSIPSPHLSFDSTFVLVPDELDKISANALAINTGFHYVEDFSLDTFIQLSGLEVPSDWHIYRLSVSTGDITISSIDAIKGKLRGKKAIVMPYAKDTVLEKDGQKIPVFGLSLGNEKIQSLDWPEVPWGHFDKKHMEMNRILKIILPKKYNVTGILEFNLLDSDLINLPLNVIDGHTDVALIPVELLGMLHTAKKRHVVYDKTLNELILHRSGYRGFRLYAKSIDDVPSIVRDLQKNEDLEVIAEVGAIERIQILDKGLTRLFWLIAIMGITGAGAVLMASLYAAVEREIKNLGTLRLLGLSRSDVFWFPVFQGVIIALISVALSIIAYLILAQIINYSFGNELPGDNSICKLPISYFMIAALTVLALAIISSFLAAWRATNIETAEAIREE